MIRVVQIVLTVCALLVASPFIVLALAVTAIGTAWERE